LAHRREHSWCLADDGGRRIPLSQGGDTGSNPVWAANDLINGYIERGWRHLNRLRECCPADV